MQLAWNIEWRWIKLFINQQNTRDYFLPFLFLPQSVDYCCMFKSFVDNAFFKCALLSPSKEYPTPWWCALGLKWSNPQWIWSLMVARWLETPYLHTFAVQIHLLPKCHMYSYHFLPILFNVCTYVYHWCFTCACSSTCPCFMIFTICVLRRLSMSGMCLKGCEMMPDRTWYLMFVFWELIKIGIRKSCTPQ